MTVLRVCYKNGFRFDEAYYKRTHLPLVGSVMGPHGLKRMEMLKVTGAPDGSKAPYQIIFSAYFETAGGVERALADPRIGEVMGDIVKFHDGAPEVMLGDVVDLP